MHAALALAALAYLATGLRLCWLRSDVVGAGTGGMLLVYAAWSVAWPVLMQRW